MQKIIEIPEREECICTSTIDSDYSSVHSNHFNYINSTEEMEHYREIRLAGQMKESPDTNDDLLDKLTTFKNEKEQEKYDNEGYRMYNFKEHFKKFVRVLEELDDLYWSPNTTSKMSVCGMYFKETWSKLQQCQLNENI